MEKIKSVLGDDSTISVQTSSKRVTLSNNNDLVRVCITEGGLESLYILDPISPRVELAGSHIREVLASDLSIVNDSVEELMGSRVNVAEATEFSRLVYYTDRDSTAVLAATRLALNYQADTSFIKEIWSNPRAVDQLVSGLAYQITQSYWLFHHDLGRALYCLARANSGLPGVTEESKFQAWSAMAEIFLAPHADMKVLDIRMYQFARPYGALSVVSQLDAFNSLKFGEVEPGSNTHWLEVR